MKEETYTASENMRRFFENLSNLKNFIKQKADETKDKNIIDIYVEFNRIFKIEEGK